MPRALGRGPVHRRPPGAPCGCSRAGPGPGGSRFFSGSSGGRGRGRNRALSAWAAPAPAAPTRLFVGLQVGLLEQGLGVAQGKVAEHPGGPVAHRGGAEADEEGRVEPEGAPGEERRGGQGGEEGRVDREVGGRPGQGGPGRGCAEPGPKGGVGEEEGVKGLLAAPLHAGPAADEEGAEVGDLGGGRGGGGRITECCGQRGIGGVGAATFRG